LYPEYTGGKKAICSGCNEQAPSNISWLRRISTPLTRHHSPHILLFYITNHPISPVVLSAVWQDSFLRKIRKPSTRRYQMSVYKRGKYWVVQFNYNKKTHTRSSKSTRKRDALELERQMRQQLIDTQALGLLGHASVKTTEKAYAAFVKNERFKQTIDLLDKPVLPKLKVVR
jgi:hypothetical protein